jgi:transposase
MELYIGLDVHSKQTTYCVMAESGTLVEQGSVVTEAGELVGLLKKLRATEGTLVGLETGVQSRWVSLVVRSAGMTPIVIDAAEVRRKARRTRQKTDSRDAFEICDGLRRGLYSSVVYVPGEPVQRLRDLLSRRRHFVKLCTMQVNAARYVVRAHGITLASGRLNTQHGWQEFLAREDVTPWKALLELHAETWRLAAVMVQRLEAELAEALEPFHEEYRRLQTAPGVGAVVAATYLAVIATPDRFPTSSHVASYLGLVPSTYDSGERERHGRITKQGSTELRSVLCEAAHRASDPRHPLNPYFVKVVATSGYRRAIVAVAHRLARILYQMWKRGEDFDVTKLGVEEGEYVVKKTRFYALKGARSKRRSAA